MGILRNLIALVALLSVMGCTRPAEEISKISIPFGSSLGPQGLSSSVSGQSAGSISYVVLNITGSGMDPIFCAYDVHEDSKSGPCQFSSNSVSLEVPIGSDRFVQALLGYDGSTSDYIIFKYGDTTATFSSGSSTVAISLAATSGGEEATGHIKGRYFTSPSSGPTGLLKVKVKPNATAPAMTIQQAEVYAGWFEAFALTTTKMEYVLNGQTLFGQPMNRASFVALPGNGASSQVVGATGFDAWGYYGDSTAVTGKSATTNSHSFCGGSVFSSCLANDSQFVGPFASDSGGNRLISIVAGAPNYVSWNYLPGIDASVIDGVTVLRGSLDLTEAQRANLVMAKGFNCESYRLTPGVSAENVGVGATQLSTGSTVLTAGPERPVAICPRKGLSLMTAAILHPRLDANGGCADCKFLRIGLNPGAVSGANGQAIVGKGQCLNLGIQPYATSSPTQTTQIQSGANFTFNVPSWAEIYDTFDCTGTALGSSEAYRINAGMSWSEPVTGTPSRYLKIIGNPANSQAFSISDLISQDSLSFYPQKNLIDIQMRQLAINVPSAMVPSTCYALNVDSKLAGNPSVVPSNLPITVSGTGMTFFGNSGDCGTSTNGTVDSYSGLSVVSYTSSTPLIFVKLNGAAPHSVTVSAGDFSNGVVNISEGAGVAQVHGFKFSADQPLTVGQCSRIWAIAINSDDVEVPVSEPRAVVIGSSVAGSGKYYGMPGCYSSELLGSLGPTLNFMTGESRKDFYFRPTTTFSGMTFTNLYSDGLIVGVSPPLSATTPLLGPWGTVSPPALPKVVLGSHNFPIQIPVAGNISGMKCYRYAGSPNFMDDGTCDGQYNISTNVFSWSAVAAADDFLMLNKYYFGSDSTSFWSNVGGFFDPKATYQPQIDLPPSSDYQTVMEVVNCDTVLIQDGTKNFSHINAALSAYDNVCLKPGTSANFTGVVGNEKIDLPSGKRIIGWLNPSAAWSRTVTLTGLNDYNVVAIAPGSSSENSYVANLNLVKQPSAALTGAISAVGTETTTSLFSSNNSFLVKTGAGAGYGIYSLGRSIKSSSDQFSFNLTGAGFAAGILVPPNPTMARVINANFSLSSTPSNFSVGVYANSTDSSIYTAKIFNSDFSGSGVALKASATAAGSAGLDCYQCKINMSSSSYAGTGFGSAGTLPPIIQNGNSSQVSLDGSSVINAHLSPLWLISGVTSPAVAVAKVVRTIVNQNVNSPFIMVTGTETPAMTMDSNHFVATSGNPLLVMGQFSSDASVVTLGVANTLGKNLFCGTGSSSKWGAALFEDTLQTSGNYLIVPGSILETTSLVSGVRYCKGAH